MTKIFIFGNSTKDYYGAFFVPLIKKVSFTKLFGIRNTSNLVEFLSFLFMEPLLDTFSHSLVLNICIIFMAPTIQFFLCCRPNDSTKFKE